MSFNLLELGQHNSKLLELLTRHLPDMLWVKDLNGVYLYANQAICDGLLMAKDTQEPIGKGDVFFALRERAAHSDKPNWHTFGELCFNSDQVVIDSKTPMKFEEYGNVKGKLLYLEVSKAPFFDIDGVVIGTVGTGRDITELKKIQQDLQSSLKTLEEQQKHIEYQANYDLLTDLPNRILLLDRLEQTISMAQRYDEKIAVLFLDLDHFKEINDSFGYSVGDKVLLEFSNRIKTKMKKSDTLARLGGDEFSILLNNITDLEDISKFVVDIMKVNNKPYIVDENTLYLGMSVGISIYPNDGKAATVLLKNADSAMHKVKQDGRNTYSFYDEAMTERVFEKVFLETALREALEKDELVVYFQPQMNATDNKVVGMEALVRWNHSTMGVLSPDKFIPLAEETGLIVALDRIVMHKAITQFSQWHKDGLKVGRLAMNLAMKQLEEDDFIEFIQSILEDKECIAEHIEFEVTESQIMSNPEKSIEILQKLSNLGIGISVDDFGTGYSSLAYLKRLPIRKLKIDRSFVKDLPDDLEDVAISRIIISLCQNLNLKVIAEGAETKEQVDFLIENGCNFIQGYYYSRPLGAEDMTKFLLSH